MRTNLILSFDYHLCFLSFVESWLETQTKAKPTAAVYGFTLDRKFPGYFSLVFKMGVKGSIEEVSVKVLPDHYVLKAATPVNCVTVTDLQNAFKEMMMQRNRPKTASTPAPAAASAAPMASSRPHYDSYRAPSSHANGGYGSHHSGNSSMGSHHYVPHHGQPVAAHQYGHAQAPPMHQGNQSVSSSSSGQWGGWGSYTGSAGCSHMGSQGGGHMTGPHHAGGYGGSHPDSRHGGPYGAHGSSHDPYGSRAPSRGAPPTPRRYMAPPGQPHPQQQPYF